MIIEADRIAKRFGSKIVLKDVTLNCKKGEAIALVGSNGSGKSTLLRILAGVTKQSSGEVRYAHENMEMAFIPDHYEKIDMPAIKFLNYTLEAYDLRHKYKELEELCSLFCLESLLNVPMKHLSKGSLQKIATIQALVGDHEILFMDEPLSGQDTLSKLHFIEEIRKRKEKGLSIIMACHETEIIEELSDRILQIKDGILLDGDKYIKKTGNKECVFILDDLSENVVDKFKNNIESYSISELGHKCKVVLGQEKSEKVFELCIKEKIKIIRYEEK